MFNSFLLRFALVFNALFVLAAGISAQTNGMNVIESVFDAQFSAMVKKNHIKSCSMSDSSLAYLLPDSANRVSEMNVYDASGNLSEHTSFFADRKVDKKQTYTYDSAGNMTSMVRYRSAFHLNGGTRKTASGETIEMFAYDEEESTYSETYTYDSKGNMITSTYHDPSGTSITTYFKYDDKGNYNVLNNDGSLRTKYTCTYKDGRLIKKLMYSYADSLLGTSEWRYSDAGLLTWYKTDGRMEVSAPYSVSIDYTPQGKVSERTYYDEQGKLFSRWAYAYDAGNFLKETVIFDADNLFSYKETYAYNANHLLTTKKMYNNPTMVMHTIKYAYTFY